jgi:HAD superfamily hydrolase (TIGR01549 family)
MNAPAPRLSCVIFDIDGTLTRTNELIFASFNHLASRHLGRVFTPAHIVSLFGPPEEGALAKVFGPENIDALMDELCEFYQHHHREMAGVHPGIDELLTFLSERRYRLAVFTGKGRRTTAITLEELDLAKYFDLIVSGNDVVHHKPDPEGIRKVMEEFDLDPGEVLMVGDSLTDIKASRNAGVRVASVLWDCHDPERVLEAKAEFVFYSVGEMLSWFRARAN